MILLLLSLAHAYDWGHMEGIFHYTGHETAYCLWDEPGVTCFARVPHDTFCLADGLLIERTRQVFKSPNRTGFTCSETTCLPANEYSSARFVGARIKNGWNRYGWMSLKQFQLLMRQPLSSCPLRSPSD